MPLAVIVAASVTIRPDARATWIIGLPFFALAFMFITNYDSNHLVAWYGGEELPLKYRFAATWAAREGPILLWAAWMALLSIIWRKNIPGEDETSRIMRLRLMNGFALTLLLVAWILEPFKHAEGKGPGLNELLQTDLMVIHPPLIFLAYSLCIVLMVVSITSIFSGYSGIKERLIHVARPAFFFATLGIGLGGLWAYLILDWGGYWAWDPVETGSLLPWICLVVLLHLRTKPNKTPDHVWAGVALACGALSLFATMVTRAGGVWAVSVHTFVVESTGTTPTDVFGRIMILLSDFSGIEVVVYLVGIIQAIGLFLASRLGFRFSFYWVYLLPAIALLGLIGGGDILGNLPLQSTIPTVIVLLGLGPFVEAGIRSLPSGHDWGWFAIPGIMVGLRFVHGMVLFELISLLFAFGLIFEKDKMKAWGWSSAGVVLFLSASWSGMLEVWICAIGMCAFISPWIIFGEDKESKFSFKERKYQQRLALWSPVVVVGLYLILTLVILIASIDAIQFAAHELYGAPFIAAMMIALTMWSMREKPERVAYLLMATPIIFVAAWLFGNSLGYDSQDILGASLSRGQIGLVVLIPALMALPATISLVRENLGKKKVRLFAHFIHLGLVLMIIGHVMSTTIIDRGTFSHSVTMIKDEKVEWEGYEFEFVEIVKTEDELEVGDGYLGAKINVYDDGELIDTVEPGVLRFDTRSRSEVDRTIMWHGDLVFIMDGTQARELMEGSDLVRIMVYDLPGIHLVWGGWTLMLLASLAIWIPKKHPLD